MCKMVEDLMKEEKKNTAIKMLAKKKLSIEDIAEITELTIEEVKELAEKQYA